MTFLDVPGPTAAEVASKAPKDNPAFTGTVTGVTRGMVGLGNVDNTSDATKLDGVGVGNPGARYKFIGGALRNTGTGFALIDDAGHTPLNVTSVTTAGDGMSLTVNYAFTAATVGAVVVVPDETLALYGYTFGASAGVDSFTITASQPAGFGDYLSWNGSAWVSLNGFITSASMNGTTGLVTCSHASIGSPIAGTATSRSLTKRVSLEGMSDTQTIFYLVDTSGVAVKTPTTDNRVWIQRAGSRRVPMSELVQANSNIWFYGMHEV